MLALLDQVEKPMIATPEEAIVAREGADVLRRYIGLKRDIKLRVAENAELVIPIPARAVALIVRFLSAMADQSPVSIIPHDAELTTKQAADFLNVSRPFLIGLLEKGEIKHRMVGTHRRVLVCDLFDYKRKSDLHRSEAIKKMVSESQKLGLP